MARRRMNIPVVLLAGALGGLCLGGAKAQAAAPATKAPVTAHPKGHYASLDALPDWGGVWVLSRPAGVPVAGIPAAGGPPAPGTPAAEKPALKGKYLQDYQAWQHDAEAKGGEGPHDV